ncbi:MAG: periplasmic heavy metal sensor [Caulobacterales bacterium]
MRGRWLVISLIVSVALNLFLIGAAAGVVALGMQMGRQNAGARPGALVRATRDMPMPDRRNMRLMLRQAWIEERPSAQQSLALRLDAWGAVADPKADPAAIKAKLAQARQLDQTARTSVEERVVDYALSLPPADRAIFAAGMRRVLTQSPNAPEAPNTGPPAKP